MLLVLLATDTEVSGQLSTYRIVTSAAYDVGAAFVYDRVFKDVWDDVLRAEMLWCESVVGIQRPQNDTAHEARNMLLMDGIRKDEEPLRYSQEERFVVERVPTSSFILQKYTNGSLTVVSFATDISRALQKVYDGRSSANSHPDIIMKNP